MTDRRSFLKLLASAPALTAAQETPLRERAAAKGMLFGAAAAWPRLRDDETYAAHFARECNALVPENILKMQLVHPAPDRYDFEPGDFMAAFAKRHGMAFRGHTLVWHQQMAPWFRGYVTKENAAKVFEEHIRAVAGHFKGRIHSWDVVNEAIEIKDDLENGMRRAPWYELLGPDYLATAFRVAHEADPAARLYYNDYGLDYDTPADDAKRAAVLALLERLLKLGAPVHGFGTQAHLNAGRHATFNPRKLRTFLRAVADLGLEILITELDVIDRDLPDGIAGRDRAVAEVYTAYLDAAFAEKAVLGALTWGLTDRYTWLARRHPRASGLPIRPLPLDEDYARKPAWQAIAKSLDAAESRA